MYIEDVLIIYIYILLLFLFFFYNVCIYIYIYIYIHKTCKYIETMSASVALTKQGGKIGSRTVKKISNWGFKGTLNSKC